MKICFKKKKKVLKQYNLYTKGKVDFNPKDLICAKCCEIPITKCPKHGTDFIEFKCRFCCQVAQWFCGGNTHYCDPCHRVGAVVKPCF